MSRLSISYHRHNVTMSSFLRTDAISEHDLRFDIVRLLACHQRLVFLLVIDDAIHDVFRILV